MFRKPVTRTNYLCSMVLAIISIVAVTLVGTSAPVSAQTVISAPQNTPVTLGADGTVTVTDTGSITVNNPDTVAIDSGGFNSEVTLFGPVSATNNVPAPSVNTILQEGDAFNTLIVRQGGDISASDTTNAANVRGVYQNDLTATHTVDLENAQITVTSTSATTRGIEQIGGTGATLVQFGSNGRLSVTGQTGRPLAYCR